MLHFYILFLLNKGSKCGISIWGMAMGMVLSGVPLSDAREKKVFMFCSKKSHSSFSQFENGEWYAMKLFTIKVLNDEENCLAPGDTFLTPWLLM